MIKIKSDNIDFLNKIQKLKENYYNYMDLYNFLQPTYNRDDYFNRWDV